MPRKGYKQTEQHRINMIKSLRGVMTGDKNPNWKGGRRIGSDGYILIYMPSHSDADCRGYVQEHRLIMEKHLGRVLLPPEIVHHINGIVNDNRIENLMLFPNCAYHMNYHRERNKLIRKKEKRLR